MQALSVNNLFESEGKMAKKYPYGYCWKGKVYFSLLRNLVCLPIFFLWGRCVSGYNNIPDKEPFLVIANHQSFLDFLFVTLALRKFKYISGFIKVKYYDLPIFSFFLKDMAQIRADKCCMKKALECLGKGHPVVLFPEGTRTRSGEIGPIYPGIELIANKFPDMPVVPIGIKGAFEIWPWNLKFPKFFGGNIISLTIGKPMFFADFKDKEHIFASSVMRKVAKLAGIKRKEKGNEKTSKQDE